MEARGGTGRWITKTLMRHVVGLVILSHLILFYLFEPDTKRISKCSKREFQKKDIAIESLSIGYASLGRRVPIDLIECRLFPLSCFASQNPIDIDLVTGRMRCCRVNRVGKGRGVDPNKLRAGLLFRFSVN